MPFTFKKLDIPEVILIEPKVFPDDRGFFFEAYKRADFQAHGIAVDFVQDNFSQSSKGVLRGMHYQKNPKAQGKLVSVVRGSVLDAVVDIRKGSPTYGKWVSAILSDKNHHMLWVPPGFAHGVLILEDNTQLMYKVSDYYSPEHDRNIRFDDPAIGIQWEIENPLLSEKDNKAPLLKNADNNFEYL
jgi:dTDP-4-dehydrorhamnose 3,5-epimerase